MVMSSHDSTARTLSVQTQRPTTIAEVMTDAPHTLRHDEKLAHAYDVMRRFGLRHLPVLEAGRLVGVLTQRDLFFVEGTAGGVDGSAERVAAAMARDVYTVAPGDLVTDVARTMSENKYGCAVVVDRGEVVGIFTATDALRLLAKTTA
jgi:acetoin utilization protein AcuB